MSEVETLEKLERRIVINLKIADVTAEVEKRLKQRAKTARADGFRPGKVPMKMVAQMYGAQTHNEVLFAKVNDACFKKIDELGLQVAGRPLLDERTGDGVADDEISYYCTFEVYPDVKLPDLSTVELERVSVEVGDEEVEKTLTILRRRQAQFIERATPEAAGGGESPEAQDGDLVTVDYVGKVDGVEFEGGKGNDLPFVLGSKRMLPDFEAGVLGMKKGETKTFDVKFPDTYPSADVAGKTAQFTLTLKKVEWAKLPEITADFVKAMGVADGTEAKLREEIRTNLTREVKNRLIQLNKATALEKLIAATDFDVPVSLVEQDMDTLVENAQRDLASKGALEKDKEFPREIFRAQAEKRVKIGLILGELLKDNVLAVTDEQLKAKAMEIASSFQNPEMVADYYMNDAGRRKELENMAMEENAVNYIYDRAKVTEKAMSFEEVMTVQV